MLTVFREMAHSLTRQLAHLEADKQRLGRDVSDERQDAVLAEVLERAIEDGERAVARTPEQLDVLRESGVVDAGGHGLVLILAGVVAALRGGDDLPEIAHQEAPRRSLPHHEDSRFRYCTNFIVAGSGLSSRDFLPRLEGLGDSVLVVGDEATLKVHVHTDTPEAAVALFEGAGAVTNLDVADMRKQMAERDARLAAGRTGVVAVAAGDGLERLFAELGADVVPGGETLNPSTYELLAGIHGVAAEEVLVLPSSSNVVMAAERACELSEKPARVVAATSQQASLLALVELDAERRRRRERRAARGGAGGSRHRRRRPGRPRRRPGPLQAGRRGRLRRRRDRRLGRVRLDPDDDDPAPRRRSRDRHRDRRRRRPDPALGDRHPCPRRRRGRDPRGGSAQLVVAARRPVVRSFAGGRELSRAELRDAPVHWPRPGVLDVSIEALDGRRPQARGSGRRNRHPHRRRRPPPLPPQPPRPRCPATGRRSRRAEPATVLVEVLGSRPRPFRKGRVTITSVKVGDDSGHVRATWFNQPWVAAKLTPRRSPAPHRQAHRQRLRGQRMGARRVRGERGRVRERTHLPARRTPRSPRPGALTPVHPATEALKAQRIRDWAEQACRWAPERDRGAARRAAGTPPSGRGRRRDPGRALSREPGGSRAGPRADRASKSCSSTRRSWRRASGPTARLAPHLASGSRAISSAAGSTRCRSSRPATSSRPSTRSTPTSTPASRCSGC